MNREGWREGAFRLTRGLKFDCAMYGATMEKIRPHVEEWYEAAKPVIGEVTFSEVWYEVVTSWERAKRPVFEDPLAASLVKVRKEEGFPPVPSLAGYDEPLVAIAYRLLFWLSLDQKGLFFISCRALGECLGIDHTKAWRLLRIFEADSVIECLKRGRMPKASRYRWNGM